jgi:hypothetical protein
MNIKAGMPAVVLVGALVVAMAHSSVLLAADEAPGKRTADAPQSSAKVKVAVAPKGHYAQLDSLPDWGGAWFLSSERGAARQPPPKLKGPYLAAYEKWRQEVKAKDGQVAVTQSNCMPPGMPVIMGVGQYPHEFLFTPGRVTVHHEAWMQWRNIYTDGRKHPEDLDPTFQGDSIGHWEGDTLVVETVGVKENLGLTAATRGPVPAHSAKLRILERIRLDPKDSDSLVIEMTLEDPEALAEPYKQTLAFRRDRDQVLFEFVCAENDRNPVDAQGNTTYTHE